MFGFAYAETYQKEAAQMIWKQNLYSTNSWAQVVIKENDQNKKQYPNFADDFPVHVWSDSEPKGKDVLVHETGIFTGVFTGNVYLKDTGPSNEISLIVKPGDGVYASYKDTTLPESMKLKSLDVIAKTEIKTKSSQNVIVNSFLVSNSTTQAATAVPASTSSECQKIEEGSKRYECEKKIQDKRIIDEFKQKGSNSKIGPVTFYHIKPKLEKSGNKDIMTIKFLVENTGSNSNVALFCTGPAVCNYTVSDGSTTYRYSGNDFVSGSLVLKPSQAKFFTMTFGPAIGYGSYVDFKYDSSKQYTFNVHESWGSGSIPLNIK